MRIAIDGMGGDHAPDEIVQGAIDAAPQIPEARLLLVGRKERLTRVGILNIGQESKKGTDLQRETYAYLDKSRLNFEFVGNIEPHELFSGNADVVVSDGFSGNLALKTAEGVKEFIVRALSSNGL